MVTIEKEKTNSIVKTVVSGKLTKEDYNQMLPVLEETVDNWGDLRWYFEMRDFEGWEPGAAFKDLKFDIKHAADMSKVAMVGDKQWEDWLTKAMKPFTTAEVKYFNLDQRNEAQVWLKE